MGVQLIINLDSETLREDLLNVINNHISKEEYEQIGLNDFDDPNLESHTEYHLKELIHQELLDIFENNNIKIIGEYQYYWYDYWFSYKDGVLNSKDGQAALTSNENQEWYLNGVPHREGDLPAIHYFNGDMAYYKHGELHRDDDELGYPQPAVIYVNFGGFQRYFKNGVEFFPNLSNNKKETIE